MTLIDLHMHTTASDGTDSPAELLELVQKAGLHTFAITDHDTISGALEIRNFLQEHQVNNLQYHHGVEFSCDFQRSETVNCRVHILGYDYDADCPAFQEVLKEGMEKRIRKLEVRLEYLERNGLHLPEERIAWLLEEVRKGHSIAKPHLALELIHAGLIPEEHRTISLAISHYLNGCKVPNDRVNALKAIQAVNASKGISVWAHPLGGEGEPRITWQEFELQLEVLKEAGLQGLECYYSRYTMEECETLCRYAGQNHLRISGGSDYHGTNKNIAIGTLNCEEQEIVPSWITLVPQ